MRRVAVHLQRQRKADHGLLASPVYPNDPLCDKPIHSFGSQVAAPPSLARELAKNDLERVERQHRLGHIRRGRCGDFGDNYQGCVRSAEQEREVDGEQVQLELLDWRQGG